LESLVGTLRHAAKVTHLGRSFVRSAIDLLKGTHRPNHYIWLNQQFKADLQWWRAFAESWIGVAYFPSPASHYMEFASDASGTWECGAWCQDKWWQFECQGFSQGITFTFVFRSLSELSSKTAP